MAFQNCISYKVVSVWDLKREIEAFENPIIFLSFYDYFDFGASVRKGFKKAQAYCLGKP